MLAGRLVRFPDTLELLAGELADRFEHPEARLGTVPFLASQQALVHQRSKNVEHRGGQWVVGGWQIRRTADSRPPTADSLSRLKRAASDEDRQAAKHGPLVIVE